MPVVMQDAAWKTPGRALPEKGGIVPFWACRRGPVQSIKQSTWTASGPCEQPPNGPAFNALVQLRLSIHVLELQVLRRFLVSSSECLRHNKDKTIS